MSVNEVKIHKALLELEVRGTGHPGSRTYAIGDEDHTLGNALRHVLMQNSKVDFAGYSVPHPSEPIVHIRVQTAVNKELVPTQIEGEHRLPATDVLKEACETLITQCDIVLDQVEELMPEVRQDRIDIEDVLRNEGYEEEEVEDQENEGYDDDMGDDVVEEY
mmetsp:Transcript_25685/g.29343  ORF Transcript_25685/g.29343 Transcript_25685/m.29343 type:complete len:162 (+) Transcript_25685:88-573(+)